MTEALNRLEQSGLLQKDELLFLYLFNRTQTLIKRLVGIERGREVQVHFRPEGRRQSSSLEDHGAHIMVGSALGENRRVCHQGLAPMPGQPRAVHLVNPGLRAYVAAPCRLASVRDSRLVAVQLRGP